MTMRDLLARIKSFYNRILHAERMDSELDEEIRSTLEMLTENEKPTRG